MGDNETVERVARAIYESSIPKGGRNYAAWDDLDSLGYETNREDCERYARAALSAMPHAALLREAMEALDGVVRNCQTIQPAGDTIAFSYADPVNPSYIVSARRVERARAAADKIRAALTQEKQP